MAAAADLALVGIAVTVTAVPLVTAGAAVRTGSVAVRHFVERGSFPPLAEQWGTFRRALLPGFAATAAVLAAAALVGLDVAALRAGRVPGGAVALWITAVVAAALLTLLLLTVVHLGDDPGGGWRSAARRATGTLTGAPLAALATLGVSAMAVVIGVLVPITIPILVGYTLFALHVVCRRLAP